MLTRDQGLAMLGFALAVMVLLFSALYLTRPDESHCLERVTQTSSRQVIEGGEQGGFTSTTERTCR